MFSNSILSLNFKNIKISMGNNIKNYYKFKSSNFQSKYNELCIETIITYIKSLESVPKLNFLFNIYLNCYTKIYLLV